MKRLLHHIYTNTNIYHKLYFLNLFMSSKHLKFVFSDEFSICSEFTMLLETVQNSRIFSGCIIWRRPFLVTFRIWGSNFSKCYYKVSSNFAHAHNISYYKVDVLIVCFKFDWNGFIEFCQITNWFSYTYTLFLIKSYGYVKYTKKYTILVPKVS